MSNHVIAALIKQSLQKQNAEYTNLLKLLNIKLQDGIKHSQNSRMTHYHINKYTYMNIFGQDDL